MNPWLMMLAISTIPVPPPRPGLLVAIEGIDGTGKSTMARALRDALVALGHRVTLTREPTDGVHGLTLRTGVPWTAAEELDLFTADRHEHVRGVIRPALARGEVVITDRYYGSTVAYQGARGIDPGALLRSQEALFPAPDLLLVLDLEPSAALQRVLARGGAPDAFEELPRLTAARRIFLGLPGAVVLDATLPPERLAEAAVREVTGRLAARRGGS